MRSPNFNARPAGGPVDMLVIHYTGMQSAEAALARLCDPASGQTSSPVPQSFRSAQSGPEYPAERVP